MNLPFKTIITAAVCLGLTACSSAPIEPEIRLRNVTYTADSRINGYFDDQEEIITQIFRDYTVERTDNREIRITIPSSYGFNTGSSAMNRDLRDSIGSLASVLNDYPETSIMVKGHTDSVGNYQYNLGLSQERADAVVEQLVKGRVHPFRLTTTAEAWEMPRCSNETAIGKDCNRRVEIYVRDIALD